jgi:hypothetical protein
LNPGHDDPLIPEAATEFLHAPDDAAAPLEAQERVAVAAEQVKNDIALADMATRSARPDRQGRVHGQDAGVAKKEPVMIAALLS